MTSIYELIIKQVHINLGKGGIAPRFYSPGGSRNLRLRVSVGGLTPNLPFPWRSMRHRTPWVYVQKI